MPYLVDEYEKCTRMHVYERAPYAGALVFAAFSGSHQDAIAKGMKYRAKNKLHQWNVPYIPIDPKDIGRTYDADVIRVNSQSGKGGIGYLLEQTYGYNLPPKMREHFSYLCKDISDHEHKELKPDEYEVKLGDKAGDGTQLRPFIVWFGEAVPEIETAVSYVEKADIFVIIGTSMNVYPAAGLLNYVPRDAEVYLIDPKPVDVHSMRQIHIIRKGASEGVQELRSLLTP
mgnify:FL=1